MSGKSTKMDHFPSTCSTWLTTSFLLLVIVKVMEIDAETHRYLSSNVPQANYENNAAYFYRQHQLATTVEQTDSDSTDTNPNNSRSKNPEINNNNSNRINCAKGGAKKFPDSKDESKFHMCTFSTAHRIWLVYSFNCPKLTIFDKKSQKCGSKESIVNAPFKRISWVQRIQQNLQQKYPSSATHSPSNSNFNSKVRLTATATVLNTKVTSTKNSGKPNNNENINSHQTALGTITTTTTEKNPTSSTMVNRTPLKNETPSYQYIKFQNVNRYPNLLQRITTTTAVPPKTNKFFNRIRPGHITQVNRRYTSTTTPASRTRTRRPSPTARTTTTAVKTTTTTTTEKAISASEPEPLTISSSGSSFNSIGEDGDGSTFNSDLHSNFESEDDPEDSSTNKVTGSNLNADGNIGVIRTVAGKIAYLAQAIESLLTAFEGSQKPCEDFQSAGILNGNPDSKIDANEVPQPAPVPAPVPAEDEPTTPSFISPSDLKNILDFFTQSNPPVNKDVANKVIGTVASASSLIPSPTTSTTTNEQNDPEDPNPPPSEPQVQTESGAGAADTTSGSSSEEEQMNEEDTVTVLRLPSPSKEFDLEESPQSQQSSSSSSQILINETLEATRETTTSPARPNNESENQIQQSEQNMNEEEEEEGETDDSEPAEWNIIVKKPGEFPTPTPPRTSTLNQLQQPQDNSPSSTSSSISTSTGSGIDDSSVSSLSSVDEVDVVLSNVKTSNEKLSAQDNIMFSIPNPTRTSTRFPGAFHPPSQAEASHPHPHPTSQSQVAPAPSRTTTSTTTDSRPISSVVSNEQADILKTGSKGSNRRPR